MLNSHLAVGASLCVTEGSILDPGFLEALRAQRCTNFAGVPYSYDLLEAVGFRQQAFPDLRFMTVAGGRLAGHLPARGLMLGFAAMMVVAAIAMLRGRRASADTTVELAVGRVLLIGATVGLVVGTVGAGGGFIVVPALVLLGGLAMERAVGTSLLVIAMQSTAGFLGHLGHAAIDWPLTLAVTAMAVIGSFVGGSLAGRVPPAQLRRAFGVFVLVMAAIVVAKELA